MHFLSTHEPEAICVPAKAVSAKAAPVINGSLSNETTVVTGDAVLVDCLEETFVDVE